MSLPHRILAVLGLGLGLGGSALAGKDDVDQSDVMLEETVSGQRPPELGVDFQVTDEPDAVLRDTSVYSERAQRGARILKTDVEFVAGCIDGIDKLYRRDYRGARDRFAELNRRYPGSATEPVGQVLVWQALMLENFDFKYVSQYELALRRARTELEEGLYQPGNEIWEYFILGGMLGIDSIHTMRTGEYLTAFNRGIEAMKAVNKAKELAPEFADPLLGDGLFNYWVTVISMSSKAIPSLGDNRAKGIEQMQKVEREAIFLGPPATLAMVFTWMEEGDFNKALASTMKNRKLYPENVVNNLVLGRVYMYMKRYEDSERAFQEVIVQEPKNERAHYYLTRLYLRTGDIPKARHHIERYLAFDLDPESRGYALYQKGVIHYRLKEWEPAEKSFEEAWKLAKLDRAKHRLDQVKERRKAAGG